MNKKAVAFAELLPYVITFIIVGVAIIVGAYLATEIRSAIKTTLSATEVNETLTTVENTTGETVALSTYPEFSMGTTPVCINASSGDLISSGNITATTAGVIKANMANCTEGGDYGLCGYDWNCTYTYDYASASGAYNASGKVVKGVGTFANMLPIIAIALVFAVIISIIVGFLVVRSRR